MAPMLKIDSQERPFGSLPDEALGQHNSPAAILAVGDFGRQTLAALNSRARLPAVGLWAGPAGWHEAATVIDAAPGEWPEPAVWWQTHGPEFAVSWQQEILQHDQPRRLPGLPGHHPIPPSSFPLHPSPMDVYLVAHLHEPFARELWRPLLDLARTAFLPVKESVFTLILATNSAAFPALPGAEVQAILATLKDLEAELEEAAAGDEPPGRIGWCYVLDSLDMHGYPLFLPGYETERQGGQTLAEESVSQTHYAAEFIALLSAGLARQSRYRRTSLADLGRGVRSPQPVAWVSTFAAGSLVLPVASIVTAATDQLAGRLLSKQLIGEDSPTDRPSAQKLRERWLAEWPLDPARLTARINRNSDGSPILFSTEPPRLIDVGDEQLIDHLMNWDTILDRRWHRSDGPPAQLAANADSLAASLQGWLNNEFNRQLQSEIGGVRRASFLVIEAENALEEERQRLEPKPNKDGEHWFRVLLGLNRSSARPGLQLREQPEEIYRRLAMALSRRLNRRAVWLRASLFAVVLLSFVWAGYLALGRPGLAGLLGWGWSSVAANLALSLDMVALAAFCWLFSLLASAVFLWQRESSIYRATKQAMAAIRHRYHFLAEQALVAEREGIYGRLHVRLGEWSQAVASRRSLLQDALAMFKAEQENGVEPVRLLTEALLLPRQSQGWAALFPLPDQPSERRLAEQYLNDPDRTNWREEKAADVLAGLRNAASCRLQDWAESLDLASWSAQPGIATSLATKVAHLRANLRPAWPLSREERAGLGLLSQNGNPVSNRGPAALLVANFVGLPSSDEERLSLPDLTEEMLFYTGEPGRLAFVSTLHGLPLKELRVWDSLKAAAQSVAEEQP